MARLKKLIEFRAKILLAFVGAYLISWFIILAAIYIAFDNQKKNEHTEVRAEFQRQFGELINQRTNTLASLLDVLSQRQEIHSKLNLANHDYLYEIYNQDFLRLKQHLGITHFYIADAERTNIVRMHSPQKYGDTVSRYAPLVRNNIKETTDGIYMGKMGSITHRVMKPLYPHDKHAGFMELGEEIYVIYDFIAKQFNASIFIMIEKHRLTEENWNTGKVAFGWQGSWDDMDDYVMSGGSNYRNMLDGKVWDHFKVSTKTGFGELSYKNREYIYDNLPLLDSSLGQVGMVFIVYPQGIVSGEFWQNLKQASLASAFAMLLGIAVCYALLRPIATAMENKQSELEEQITIHTEKLLVAKERAVIERNKAVVANKAKSDFLSNMSHELRTPLNSIIGFSSIVKEDEFDDGISDRYRSYVEDIHKAGAHLLAIINDILDVSRIEAGEMDLKIQQVEVNPLLADCQRMINVRATTRQIAIIHDHYDDDLMIEVDPTRLKQIMLNLLSNAVKFTVAPGIIRFSALKVSSKKIKFIVMDEGCGVAEGDVPEVLRRFGQVGGGGILKKALEEGTGLGLTLVQDLIRMHSGTFDFSSVEGKGTTVTFTLPITHERSPDNEMI